MRDVRSLLTRISTAHASKPKHLYHFTSTANLPSIREHGLLSQRHIVEAGLKNVDYVSDRTSRSSDRIKKLDGFVHLCFFSQHRMAHVAKDRSKSGEIAFLPVMPDVLTLRGVLLSKGAANRSDVEIADIPTMLPKLDWEVIYSYTDWRDKAVLQRLNDAKMYEILVPEKIATEYLILP